MDSHDVNDPIKQITARYQEELEVTFTDDEETILDGGFGPGTANIFRNMSELPEARLEDKGEQQHEGKYPKQHHLNLKQSTLFEILDFPVCRLQYLTATDSS